MDRVFITVEVLDAEKIDIALTDEGKLTFKAESHSQKFGFDFELYNGVIKDQSGWNTKGRNVTFSITKKEDDRSEYWPRLTKDKTKNSKISIDWSKWVDEDQVEDAPTPDGYDPSQMQGFGGGGMDDMMGGMGGPGGMDMSKLQEMMKGMKGGDGLGGMGGPDSDDDDDEEEEAAGEPKPSSALADLDGEAEK